MVKIVLATLVTAAAAGACGGDEQTALADSTNVGEKQDSCARKALSLVTGIINHEKFISCVESEFSISAGCAECYYTVAEYDFENCKAACLLGWCKFGCLSCTQPAQDGLSACTGFSPSVAAPCLESTGACADEQAALVDADSCARTAQTVTGYNHDKFISCLESEFSISAGCAECYYTVAEYDFENCKGACLLGWCKSSCLSCRQPAQDGFSVCTGFSPPDPCMEMVA